MSMAKTGTERRTTQIIKHIEDRRTLDAKREIIELYLLIRNSHYGDAVASLGAFLNTWVEWSMQDIRDPVPCQICGCVIAKGEARERLDLLGFGCMKCTSGSSLES